MNEKNFEYLKNNIKYHGFGDKADLLLHTELQKQLPEFTLRLDTEVNKEPVSAELYFKRSKETDMYFFNRYSVQMKNEKEGAEVSQTFYLNNSSGITLKEAYNLLNGRSVYKELENKEGEKYKAWVKLDFSEKDGAGNYKRIQYHENYGYDINAVLNKYSIKELNNEKQQEDLVRSLQKGNIQIASFEKNGTAEKLYVEANPQFKAINVYDMKMNRIQSQELAERYGQSVNGHSREQETKQEKKQGSKKTAGDDESSDDGKRGKKRNRRQGIS